MARVILLCLLLFSSGAHAAASVTAIRLGEHKGGVTRIVIDSTSNIDFKVFTLLNPHRLVVDVESADILLDKEKMPAPKGLVKNVRWGHYEGKSRIAIELADAVTVKNQLSLPPASGMSWRLVIDVAGIGADAPTPARTDTKKKVDLRKKRIIVVDPGHGGKDPGAIGISGVKEKILTLAAGLELKRQLEATGRYKVFMTRSTDKALALRERVQIARANNAALFISVHADSAPNKKAQGLSVYTLSDRASDADAKALAERENKADIIAGIDFSDKAPEVADILIDLAKRETQNFSSLFAEMIVEEISQNVKVLKDTHRFAGFAVLRAPDIPSVLVEMGYLSNRQEEKMMQMPAYRTKIVSAIVKSIDRYFKLRDANFNF